MVLLQNIPETAEDFPWSTSLIPFPDLNFKMSVFLPSAFQFVGVNFTTKISAAQRYKGCGNLRSVLCGCLSEEKENIHCITSSVSITGTSAQSGNMISSIHVMSHAPVTRDNSTEVSTAQAVRRGHHTW